MPASEPNSSRALTRSPGRVARARPGARPAGGRRGSTRSERGLVTPLLATGTAGAAYSLRLPVRVLDPDTVTTPVLRVAAPRRRSPSLSSEPRHSDRDRRPGVGDRVSRLVLARAAAAPAPGRVRGGRITTISMPGFHSANGPALLRRRTPPATGVVTVTSHGMTVTGPGWPLPGPAPPAAGALIKRHFAEKKHTFWATVKKTSDINFNQVSKTSKICFRMVYGW